MIRELTSLRRLDRESAPLRLYGKAKRLGTWNPSDIELTRHREEWARLTEAERDLRARAGPVRRVREEVE
jgi:ribonucleoside-diphosphate reductase beta chain